MTMLRRLKDAFDFLGDWPAAAWELRRINSDGRRWKVRAAVVFCIAAFLLAAAFFVEFKQPSTPRAGLRRSGSLMIHAAFMIASFYVGLLYAPVASAALYCRDVKNDALTLLLTSRTTALGLVLARVVRTMADYVGVMLMGAPFAIAIVLLGWGRGDVLVQQAVFGFSIYAMGAAAGLASAVWIRRLEYAISLAMVIAVVAFGVVFARFPWALLAPIQAVESGFSPWRSGWDAAAGFTCSALILLLLAAASIRPLYRRRLQPESTSEKSKEKSITPWSRPPVSDEPLIWREFHAGYSRKERWLGRAIWVFYTFFVLWLAIPFGGVVGPGVVLAMFLLLVASFAGFHLYVEDRAKILDFLRTTPLEQADFVRAKFVALKASLIGFLPLFSAVLAWSWWSGKSTPLACAASFAIAVEAVVLTFLIGLRFAFRCLPPLTSGGVPIVLLSVLWAAPAVGLALPTGLLWREYLLTFSPCIRMNRLMVGGVHSIAGALIWTAIELVVIAAMWRSVNRPLVLGKSPQPERPGERRIAPAPVSN